MTVADVVYVVGVADRGLGIDLRLQLLEDVELALWLHYCHLQHTGKAGKTLIRETLDKRFHTVLGKTSLEKKRFLLGIARIT